MALPSDFKTKVIDAMVRAGHTSVDGLSVSQRSVEELMKLYQLALTDETDAGLQRAFRIDYFKPGGAVHSKT